MSQVFSKEASKFLRESITYVMSEREKSGHIRQDLIDTLVSLKNEDKGKSRSAKSNNIGRKNLPVIDHLNINFAL